MLSRKTRIFIAGLLILCASGCRKVQTGLQGNHVPFTTATDRKPVGPEVSSLHVATLAGSVRVVGDAEDEVRVEASVKIERTRAKTESDTGSFADHVMIDIQGGTLSVTDAHMNQDDRSDWHVSLVIHAPARLAATVSATAGEIQVDGMNADLNLTSDAGRIMVKGERLASVAARATTGAIDIRAGSIRGGVDATVGVGDVSVRVTTSAPTENVSLKADAGNVLLELPQEAPGTYRAKSEIGHVSISGREGITVTRSGLGAHAEGRVGEGGPTYDLTANVGAVTIR